MLLFGLTIGGRLGACIRNLEAKEAAFASGGGELEGVDGSGTLVGEGGPTAGRHVRAPFG